MQKPVSPRNAIILAAGTSSRFVPLSYEKPKALLEVKGEILIERQIRQLIEAGISDITVVVGYMADKFEYLKDKYGICTVFNEDFDRYNNTSSIIRVLDKLGNTFICSSDNYFPSNVFIEDSDSSYYSALFAHGKTKEYCLQLNKNDEITDVSIGGCNSWYMIGHVFFSADFSSKFKSILKSEYEKESTKKEYWEDVYMRNIDKLPPMKIKRHNNGEIEEFDTLEELRNFDSSYVDDTRSTIIKNIAKQMCCKESELKNFRNISQPGNNLLFSFETKDNSKYYFNSKNLLILPLSSQDGAFN